MSSGKGEGRVATEVVRLRPVGKRVLQIYISEHFLTTGEKLTEWDAWERIVQAASVELWGKAIALEDQTNGNSDD